MMRRILKCCGLVIASLIVIAAFVTATNYVQLVVAILLYPLLAYLIYKCLPHRAWAIHFRKTETIITRPVVRPAQKIAPAAEVKKETVGIADIDKRVFLKLIGGAGLTFFFLSLLNKKAEGLFFRNMPGPGTVSLEDTAGNKIDPAQRQPTDGYRISQIDDNDITFYGFTNKDGAWFIMKEDIEGSFRYVRGENNFPASWASRELLHYDYFDQAF